MRQYTKIAAFSDGSALAIGKPGITYKASPLTLWLFCQSGIIFRVEKDALSTAVAMDVTVTDSNSDTVVTHYSFAFGDEIYADVTDIVRSMVVRALPNAIGQAGTSLGGIVFELFDTDGVSVGSVSAEAIAIDALDYAYEDAASGQWPGVPEHIRLHSSAWLTFPALGSSGQSTVMVKYGGSSATLDNAGQAATLPASTVPSDYVLVDDDDEIARCEVELVDCTDDSVMLRWWSVELGGWKTCAWDVLEAGQAGDRVTLFDRLYARNAASDASNTLRLRVPLCTHNEWAWLRDIAISDQVEMLGSEKIAVGGATNVWRSVVVEQQSSTHKMREDKDFEIVITTAEASSL